MADAGMFSTEIENSFRSGREYIQLVEVNVGASELVDAGVHGG